MTRPMTNRTTLLAALRRDIAFLWNAVAAVVVVGFAGFAVGAAIVDVAAIAN